MHSTQYRRAINSYMTSSHYTCLRVCSKTFNFAPQSLAVTEQARATSLSLAHNQEGSCAMEDTVQDNRAGSCESESWSDGFVQVTQEDARLASSGSGIEDLLEDTEGTRIPAVDDEVDLYGAPEGDGSDEEEEGEGMPAAAEGGEVSDHARVRTLLLLFSPCWYSV